MRSEKPLASLLDDRGSHSQEAPRNAERMATEHGFNVTQGPGSELRRAWIKHMLDTLYDGDQAAQGNAYSVRIKRQ